MYMYRPLRIALFVYELARLCILMTLFTTFAPPGWDEGAFPYMAYISANGLFLLMALFLLLDPELYAGYLSLYGAGKGISLVVFYAGGIAAFRQAMAGGASVFDDPALFSFPEGWGRLGGGVIIALGDGLSMLGAGALFVKCRKVLKAHEGAKARQGEIQKNDEAGETPEKAGVLPAGEA